MLNKSGRSPLIRCSFQVLDIIRWMDRTSNLMIDFTIETKTSDQMPIVLLIYLNRLSVQIQALANIGSP
jgi:hypothetical protein